MNLERRKFPIWAWKMRFSFSAAELYVAHTHSKRKSEALRVHGQHYPHFHQAQLLLEIGPCRGRKASSHLPAALHPSIAPSTSQTPSPGGEVVWSYRVCKGGPVLAVPAALWAGVGARCWGRRVTRVRAVPVSGVNSSLERISNALAMGVALWILAEASSKGCGKWWLIRK